MSQQPRELRLVPGAALVCLVLVAYVPALAGGWIWDDDAHVTANPALRSAGGLARIWLEPGATPQYYPLVFTSFWVEYHLWGDENAAHYHLANVLLHGANAWLVWRVLRRLGVPGAWLAAAVFALHPVHVESVAWVTERKNVLSAMFYLTALLAFLRFDETRSRGWYALALAAFLAALLSKTVTCTLPAVLALLLWWQHGRISWRDGRALAPLFAVGVGMGLLTVWVEKYAIGAAGADWSLSPLERCLIAGRAVWFYAGKLVWPEPLTFIYPRWQVDSSDAWWYAYPVAALAVLAGLWLARGRLGKGPLVAALAFVGTLFPALGFFDIYPFRYSFVADHFQYLASVPLIALAAAVAATALRHRPALKVAAAAAVLIAFGQLTVRQGFIYLSEEFLWRDTLAKNPDCSIAHARLGRALAEHKDYLSAAEHYAEVARLDAATVSIGDRLRLASNFGRAGRLDWAADEFRAVLAVRPESSLAHGGLAETLRRLGRRDEAAAHFEEALNLDPDNAELHNGFGSLRAEQGRLDEAAEHFNAALRLDPSNRTARRSLDAMKRAGGVRLVP
jgi:tetratricopeptide (TPR) repeat protein